MIAYLVVRASISTHHREPFTYRDFHTQPLTDDGGPVEVPEAVFRDRNEAERDRERRELAARDLLNPFSFTWGDLESICSDAEALRGRLADLELTPPPVGPTHYRDDWWAWWDVESPAWTDAQRAAVWELLDRIRLFHVVEIELE